MSLGSDDPAAAIYPAFVRAFFANCSGPDGIRAFSPQHSVGLLGPLDRPGLEDAGPAGSPSALR